ncbi:hypothetical protein K144313037_02840 [Clostridium tetani]|uniref:FeoA family protein n=1 Tax=Clostridium tetani TaxID=1513 RepID=UPI000D21EF7B|nr:FeoA family protein [Clostridium tetani]AVP55968.1 ferrous iron transport protein A [Clostridium tetani]RXI74935.1 ferrous iron transport protein A [Clostridium tetani]RXI77254.1 ferrous iron transport protein A [Clostridium tetani]WFN62299.1 FeoA family protein [Clostridium tetani]SUY54478.1 ferrous iron transport protein A [Clostridium tetani]
MENTLLPLNKAPIGSIVSVMKLISDGISRRRMLDLGLIQGTKVQCLRQSPSGDPTAYEIRGAVIALRSEEASKILVQLI